MPFLTITVLLSTKAALKSHFLYWLLPPRSSNFLTEREEFTPATASKIATMAILPILTNKTMGLQLPTHALNKLSIMLAMVTCLITNCNRVTSIHVLSAKLAFAASSLCIHNMYSRQTIKCPLPLGQPGGCPHANLFSLL